MNQSPVWVAWRIGGNFGRWHRSYDPKQQWTTCGKSPNGIVSTRTSPPPPKEECGTCVLRDQLRVRSQVKVQR
jgi:hypothetical protein